MEKESLKPGLRRPQLGSFDVRLKKKGLYPDAREQKKKDYQKTGEKASFHFGPITRGEEMGLVSFHLRKVA